MKVIDTRCPKCGFIVKETIEDFQVAKYICPKCGTTWIAENENDFFPELPEN